MFKRLYAFGGIAYVLGGLGLLAMLFAVVALVLGGAGISFSRDFFKYTLIAALVGGVIVSIVFNSGNMQVVAQNHTTATLEKISQQLAEQAAADNLRRRNNRRPGQRKQAREESAVAQGQERVETPVAETAPQEGYHCPVSKAFIPVR